MHFSHSHQGPAGKATKIAVVTALHLAIGSVLLQMGPRPIITDVFPQDVTLIPTVVEPAPQPEPLKSEVRPEQLPTIIVPEPEVNIQDTPAEPVLQTVRTAGTPDAVPAVPGVAGGEGIAKPTVAPPPAMRSAVLADAKSCATPDYPARAARNGETGTVTLALLVGTNGAVINSRILTSSGSRELDRAAQSALSMCAFQPAMENGVAQEGWARISYLWTLD